MRPKRFEMLIVAVLATVNAAWPRLETGDTWYRAVHVPKSGGTTHDRALVAVYCLTLPLGIVQQVEWMTPFVVLLVSYAFYGLDAIGDSIEEPFGGDMNDLPLEQLSTMIEINVREAIGDTDLPAPIVAVDHVLR